MSNVQRLPSVVFVYQPTTGSRVFAAVESPEIHRTRYSNGSQHVLGGIHLSWVASTPKEYWRNEGRALLESLIGSFGGIAWDEQGFLNAIVPRQHARLTWEAAAAFARARGSFQELPVGELIAAGLATYQARWNGHDVPPTWIVEWRHAKEESIEVRIDVEELPGYKFRTTSTLVYPAEDNQAEVQLTTAPWGLHVD